MRKLSIAVALSAALAGCGVYGYDTYGLGYASPSSYGVSLSPYGANVYTSIAPPAPLLEVAPPAPGLGYAWINGYWGWGGDQYVWNRGYWAQPPGPGYGWQPFGWVPYANGYRFVPGRWYRYGHAREVPYVYPYPPVRYGPRYSVIPRGPHPHGYIPPQYWGRGPVRAVPGRSYVYRVPGPRYRH
jgi:hypothetical protein